MIRLPKNLKAVFTHPRFRQLFPLTVTSFLIALLGVGVAWSEYQTNWFARRLGTFLLSTNALRPQTGTLWKQIQAQSETQQTIDTTEPLPPSQAGLPKPVINNRFASTRVPETGPPSYVAIYTTPLSNTDPSTRPLGDVITSLRTYRQGLAIMNALHLPDVHFHAQIRNRVENLYTDLGDMQISAPDPASFPDTFNLLDPDSLKAAVFSELATELIPNMRQREKTALVDDYKNGAITQIFLHRDLGRFRGELHHEAGTVAFEADANTISQIMNLPKRDTLSISTTQ